MNEREALIALNMLSNVGSIKLNRLISRFGNAAAVFSANEQQLKDVDGIGDEIGNAIRKFDPASLDMEISAAARLNVRIVTLLDAEYPEKLKNIYDPPPVLYMAGRPFQQEEISIGVVGTRLPTDYGCAATARIIKEMGLSEVRFSVISGMARGIDSVAHVESIKNNLYTAAVLGFGLKRITPLDRYQLARGIAEKGTLITEFPLEAQGLKQNFPRRNRVISGLSDGVIVMEAAEKSGALITSDQAMEQGREVFALPGSIFSEKSAGTHALIKQGARMITGVNDIIEEFRLLRGRLDVRVEGEHRAAIMEKMEPQERKIMEILGSEKKHVDNIAVESNIDVIRLNPILTVLELKGFVRQLGGKNFVRNI